MNVPSKWKKKWRGWGNGRVIKLKVHLWIHDNFIEEPGVFNSNTLRCSRGVFESFTPLPSQGKLVLQSTIYSPSLFQIARYFWRNSGFLKEFRILKMCAKSSNIEKYLNFKLEHKLGVFEVGRSIFNLIGYDKKLVFFKPLLFYLASNAWLIDLF